MIGKLINEGKLSIGVAPSKQALKKWNNGDPTDRCDGRKRSAEMDLSEVGIRGDLAGML